MGKWYKRIITVTPNKSKLSHVNPKAYLKGILKVIHKEPCCGVDMQKSCITSLYKLPKHFCKDQWEHFILLNCANYGQEVHSRLTKSCEPDWQEPESDMDCGPPNLSESLGSVAKFPDCIMQELGHSTVIFFFFL